MKRIVETLRRLIFFTRGKQPSNSQRAKLEGRSLMKARRRLKTWSCLEGRKPLLRSQVAPRNLSIHGRLMKLRREMERVIRMRKLSRWV